MDHSYYLNDECDHSLPDLFPLFWGGTASRFNRRVSKWNQGEARNHDARITRWADRKVRENPSESFRASLQRTSEGAAARHQLVLLGIDSQNTSVLMEYRRRNGSSI